jgi:diadenosine tetraphosphatase ApaH/serine/threonine PP2A family protein phosphatase
MLAMLYDVHGNLPALEAVLQDADAAGADTWLLGGDYAAFGAWPVECVERLRELGDAAAWIHGNWERWQAKPEAAIDNPVVRGANDWVRAALGGGLVAELGALADTVERDGTLFCHASPRSDVDPIPREPDAGADARLLAGVTARRVVFGHTHLQFERADASGARELVNPGSVGLPWDGDTRAAYALLDPARDAVSLRRVAYDVEAAASALDAIGEPWAATTAARLRAARFDVEDGPGTGAP